jgi:hypothetical protein
MIEPIFVVDDTCCISIFSTARALELYAEAVDVQNGVYSAIYDREGHVLELKVCREKANVFGISSDCVNIAETSEIKREDLRGRILESLNRIYHTSGIEKELSLAELVELCLTNKWLLNE